MRVGLDYYSKRTLREWGLGWLCVAALSIGGLLLALVMAEGLDGILALLDLGVVPILLMLLGSFGPGVLLLLASQEGKG